MSVIAPGTPAPSLRLQREDGERFTEQDLRGHTTILVFYPFAFSPVCTDQLQVYEQALGELTAGGTEVYGVSCDSSYAADRVQGEARREHSPAIGLRAQGRRVRRAGGPA